VTHPENCRFAGYAGDRCQHTPTAPGGFCAWHDPKADRSHEDVKPELERLVAAGDSLEGFVLHNAHLEGAHLAGHDGRGVNMRGVDLSRAHLQGAHLYRVDFSGGNFLKANVSGANLNRAWLVDANLLGTVFTGARLEHVQWGGAILQEKQAQDAKRIGKHHDALNDYGEAELIYRTLRKTCDSVGMSDEAGFFFQKEMRMKRLQRARWSKYRFFSKLTEVSCGYGERPARVVTLALGLVLLFALAYFVLGLEVSKTGLARFDLQHDMATNLTSFGHALYYSFGIFTKMSVGDITPLPFAKVFAALESFMGAFSMALFVLVFVKRMVR